MLASAALSTTVCVVAASPALATEVHGFDPVLSLEGNCTGADGVRDPGCPYLPPPEGPRPFASPCGVTTDLHGDIYVSTPTEGDQGRIDIFNPSGKFLIEISSVYRPCRLAVDSLGNLYVAERQGRDFFGSSYVERYEPDAYPPSAGTTYSIGAVFELIRENGSDACEKRPTALAVDPSNDHLYLGHECRIEEYGSAAEGTPLNPLIKCCIGAGKTSMNAIAVYGRNHDVYATESTAVAADKFVSDVLIFDGGDDQIKCKLEGTGEALGGEFDFGTGGAIGLDQSSGDLYVYDISHGKIDRFAASASGCPTFVEQDPKLPVPPKIAEGNVDLTLDSPCRSGLLFDQSCNLGTYSSPNSGYVFTTVGTTATNSHLYAFAPKVEGPPEVRNQVASGIGVTEAVLGAELSPHGLTTAYHFEYTTQADFDLNGYANATSVPSPDASTGSGVAFAPLVEAVTGLAPGTAYRFRLVAENAECTTAGEGVVESDHEPCDEGPDASFSTYPDPPVSGSPCSNALLRVGSSASLPDCRAYELVTPPDTNGRTPSMATLGEGFGGVGFDTRLASPDGGSLVFGSNTGALPGIGGGGFQDTYEALRDPESGWQSQFTGLSAVQSDGLSPGGISDDHHYASWNVRSPHGSLGPPPGESEANYLRGPAGAARSPNCAIEAEPEGPFEWIGCGSLGFEPRASSKWIGPGGKILFETNSNNSAPARKLEPCASPSGTTSIYERTPGGPTRCISLLPGDIPPGPGVKYLSASANGDSVAFSVSGTLYVRRGHAETLTVAAGGDFGGISTAGDRVFYVKGGDIFACDLAAGGCTGEGAHAPIPVGSGGQSTLVNVSADGSHAYFVSTAVLTGLEENGYGAKAKSGEENLYAWDGVALHFLAILDPRDVSGEGGFGGLGLWVKDVFSPGTTTGPANDPSRTTPDGTVLLFESKANLTDYASAEHREIYRYDSQAEPAKQLSCLSCNPTGVAAASDAQLESKAPISIAQPFPPVNSLSHIDNITIDGKQAFFQSADRLVSADVDGKVDVYEWEAAGIGGCGRASGCLSLISGGQSTGDDYLYGMTPNGSNVFFLSTDSLLAQDPDGTPSIYDARVVGGFPSAPTPNSPCAGEACRSLTSAPDDPTPASSSFEGPGRASHSAKRRHCAKGKSKAHCGKQHGKKKHARHKGSHRNAKGRTAR